MRPREKLGSLSRHERMLGSKPPPKLSKVRLRRLRAMTPRSGR